MADPDIFISYSHANHDIAERLAHVFEEAGHTVWWDRELDAGSRFRAEIQQNLDTARVVVVIWTAASVESDWVLGEAATARDRGVLVPVSVGECTLPIEFRQLHTADLGTWFDKDRPEELERLLDDIGARLDPSFVPEPRKRRYLLAWQASRRRKLAVAALATLVAAVVVVSLVRPTAFSQLACRKLQVCLSGAPRIEHIEPIGDRFSLVTLHRSVDGPAVYATDSRTLFVTSGSEALLYDEDVPHVGDYVPTGIAGQSVVDQGAERLVRMSPTLLLNTLDRFPGIAAIDVLREELVTRLDVRGGGKSCEELADNARRLVARQRLGGPTNKVAMLRTRLAVEALPCVAAVLPAGW